MNANVAAAEENNNANNFVIKLVIGDGENEQIRRVRVSQIMDKNDNASYKKLEGVALKLVDAQPSKDYSVWLTYRDIDSDTIRLGSTEDLQDAIEQFKNENFLRVFAKVVVKNKDDNNSKNQNESAGEVGKQLKSPPPALSANLSEAHVSVASEGAGSAKKDTVKVAVAKNVDEAAAEAAANAKKAAVEVETVEEEEGNETAENQEAKAEAKVEAKVDEPSTDHNRDMKQNKSEIPHVKDPCGRSRRFGRGCPLKFGMGMPPPCYFPKGRCGPRHPFAHAAFGVHPLHAIFGHMDPTIMESIKSALKEVHDELEKAQKNQETEKKDGKDGRFKHPVYPFPGFHLPNDFIAAFDPALAEAIKASLEEQEGTEESKTDRDEKLPAKKSENAANAPMNVGVEESKEDVASEPTDSVQTPVATMVEDDSHSNVLQENQRDRWAMQLQQLKELGFYDEARYVDILERLTAANIGVGSDEEVTVAQVLHHVFN